MRDAHHRQVTEQEAQRRRKFLGLSGESGRTHHSPGFDDPVLPIFHVRPSVWACLACAILIAVLAPGVTFYRLWSQALTVSVCVLPSTPRSGEPVRLVVVPSSGSDQEDVMSPWTRVEAQWDMIAMEMGVQRLSIPGTAARGGAFLLPLSLTMPGLWRVDLSLDTPGRPVWQTQVTMWANPAAETKNAPSGASSPASPPSQLLAACGATVRIPSRVSVHSSTQLVGAKRALWTAAPRNDSAEVAHVL